MVPADELHCSGVLVLDKPAGVTSRDAVNVVQRLIKPLKVGHAGTLDPLATGVLVLALGAGTRLISLLQTGRKVYEATFRLGCRSNTDDHTGEVTPGGDPTPITHDQIAAALTTFLGRISQVPPQFSAVHVEGQRAYDLARRGTVVDLQPRLVEVHEITLHNWSAPDLSLTITCGSGTYIRSIARDLGEHLGCGGLMTALRRTAVGPFTLATALPLDAVTPATIVQSRRPLAAAVAALPRLILSTEEERAVRQGQCLIPKLTGVAATAFAGAERSTTIPAEVALLRPDGTLIGLAEPTQRRAAAPNPLNPLGTAVSTPDETPNNRISVQRPSAGEVVPTTGAPIAWQPRLIIPDE